MNQITDIDVQIARLEKAEDAYYINATTLLEPANRAYDLFRSSEVEEKRQLIMLTLQNLRLEGKKVRYDLVKPFGQIFLYADRQQWLPLVNAFKNREIEFEFSLRNIQTVFETFDLSSPFDFPHNSSLTY